MRDSHDSSINDTVLKCDVYHFILRSPKSYLIKKDFVSLDDYVCNLKISPKDAEEINSELVDSTNKLYSVYDIDKFEMYTDMRSDHTCIDISSPDCLSAVNFVKRIGHVIYDALKKRFPHINEDDYLPRFVMLVNNDFVDQYSAFGLTSFSSIRR